MAYPANSIIEVRVNYDVNAQECYNVLHYKPIGNSAGFDEQELLDGFLDNIVAVGNGSLPTELSRLLATNANIDRVIGQIIWPVRYKAQLRDLDVAGIRAGDCEAQNVASVILKHGRFGARSSQGRMHIGGIPADDLNNGLLAGGYVTALGTFITNFLDIMWTDNLSPVEYDPTILNKTYIPETDTYVITGDTQIVSWGTKNEIRTMRRRTFRVGI